METIPFMIPSTSLSVASLKLASQTPMILWRSSSRPFSLLSSACSSKLMSMKTGTFMALLLVAASVTSQVSCRSEPSLYLLDSLLQET